MWPDNESKIDLLGFDILVDELVVALTDEALHPLTVGVLGPWGSGKSSLLTIALKELEEGDGGTYACVSFSPWEYEDVEDVKTALMTAVLNKCLEYAPTPESKRVIRRLRDRLPRFGRRAGAWALTAAPAVIPAVATAVDPSMGSELVGAAQAVAQSAGAAAARAVAGSEPAEQGGPEQDTVETLAGFRRDLAEMMRTLPVDAVVIFIDDLDRCLPPTIVDTFEALRLFLHTPKTAHVVAASRSIVEAAIDSRYPDFKREDGKGLGHDYLEKMLQLQVRVPDLSAVEIETYLNLLLTQNRLSEARFQSLIGDLRESRKGVAFPAAYNAATAAELLKADFSEELAKDLAWAAGLTDLAASGLRGNPREIKRFLNDLTWRRRAAKRRSIDLRADVLGKLMVLEEQQPDDFQRIFDWQHQSGGPSSELRLAEEFAFGRRERPVVGISSVGATAAEGSRAGDVGAARRTVNKPTKKVAAKKTATAIGPETTSDHGAERENPDVAVEKLVSDWVARPRIASWLQLPPQLSDVDLGIYFSYFRDRLVIGSAASALSPRLQELLGRINDETAPRRRTALDEVSGLPEPDQDALLEALLDKVMRTPNSDAFRATAELGGRVPRLGAAVCEAYARLPHNALGPMRILPALTQLRSAEGFEALLASWRASTTSAVASAAAAATRTGR